MVLRLRPDQDLKEQLLLLAQEQHWEAACIVTCVGSLSHARLRFAGQSLATDLPGPWEIVSLVGCFSRHGGHFHISFSDSTGKTLGGHLLEGSRVFTTAEIVVMPLPHYRFQRVLDPQTGYPELRPLVFPKSSP